MSQSFDFSLPEYQSALVQISLAPPTSISGWTIQLDLMYRFNSAQPIVSKYLASGYTTGQSGITLVNGAAGIFNVSFNQPEISGASTQTNVLGHLTHRTDSGFLTPLVGGYRLLSDL